MLYRITASIKDPNMKNGRYWVKINRLASDANLPEAIALLNERGALKIILKPVDEK